MGSTSVTTELSQAVSLGIGQFILTTYPFLLLDDKGSAILMTVLYYVKNFNSKSYLKRL